MAAGSDCRRLLRLFADILDYPRPDLPGTLAAFEPLQAPGNAEATALLRDFRTLVEETPLARLQEVYTRTFDLDATCHLYVGYHLFGESYKRSAFLLGLKERYRLHGFTSPESELPDHLPVMLRFLAVCSDPGLADELIQEAMIPALEKMMGKKGDGESPDAEGEQVQDSDEGACYRRILRALGLLLQSPSGGTEGRTAEEGSPACGLPPLVG